MSLATTYLVKTSNLEEFIEKLLQAQAPDKFSHKFLYNLGFKSTNDRLFIGVLKSLGLLDESGSPTQLYYEFLDRSQTKTIIASRLKVAYADLFGINKEAYNMSVEDIKNKLKSLTQGSKSDSVLTNMARTFKALSEYAEWTETPIIEEVQPKKDEVKKEGKVENKQSQLPIPEVNNKLGLHYNIQIHLPPSRDIAVYDAIFESLKKHILNG